VALKGPVRTPIGGGFQSVNKANILKLSDGLFLRCCRRVAREYREIRYDELIVDNAAMQLVTSFNRGLTDAVIRHLELPAAA
jgi:isocitrate dehydrogenase